MRVGMRWWLAVAFAIVAATTTIAVVRLSSDRSEDAFRERAQALAAGKSLEAAIELRGYTDNREIVEVAQRRRLALFVFADGGRLLSDPQSNGIDVMQIPNREEAVDTALDGRRFVATDAELRATVVAIRLTSGDARALLAYASHPDLAAELGLVHDEIARSAWVALLLGGTVGAVIATLIARRLRRIAAAAAAIEQGDFETRLSPDFRDELGDLAVTFDRMRERLRRSFQQLEADRDRLEELLERLHEGVVAVDAALTVQFANGAARAYLGAVAPGEPLPEPWAPVSLREFATALFDGRGVVERRVEPDEESVHLLIGIPAARDDVAVLVIRDLTEQERLERAEREFVANASHELRTPLTTILGAVELLQAGAKDRPEDRDRFLEHIEREATRLVSLTRALLILARAQTRAEAARLASVEVRPLLEDVAAATRARPGVEVTVSCESDLAVTAQPDLLEQALMNLASNAAEHTRDGKIVLAAHPDGNGGVVIAVRDSGPGVPPAVRTRIFDRFYRPVRDSADGFGLGLAIVREAVRAQGGEVELDDAPEGGARVTIHLPRSRR